MRISLLSLIFSASVILAQHNMFHSRDLFYEHIPSATVSYSYYSTLYPMTTTSKKTPSTSSKKSTPTTSKKSTPTTSKKPTPTTTCTRSKKTRSHRNRNMKKRQFIASLSKKIGNAKPSGVVVNADTVSSSLIDSSASSFSSQEEVLNRKKTFDFNSNSSVSDQNLDDSAAIGAKEESISDSSEEEGPNKKQNADVNSNSNLKNIEQNADDSSAIGAKEESISDSSEEEGPNKKQNADVNSNSSDIEQNVDNDAVIGAKEESISDPSEEGLNKRQGTDANSDSSKIDQGVDGGAAIGAKEGSVSNSDDPSEKDLKKRITSQASYSYNGDNDRQHSSPPNKKTDVHSVTATNIYFNTNGTNDKLKGKNDHPDKKNHPDSRNGGSNSADKSKPKPNGYYINGRYWYWNSRPDVAFMNSLKHKPSFADQRFQHLYTYCKEFKKYWDSRLSFRSRWNRSSRFRSKWFGQVNFNKSKRH
ncbi:hypothetical protein AYI68_g6000 [Smittium mucronatum]|uniref:Uncharacterized protein n=1 Tax=Smittium mucronatum TaxID=133383 RepID=A0A1R0GSU3_9FUNG|nr:hypothetical protein AYI68_g6000 [Smittium mucronatum]